jgi:hypothetical protein
MNVYKGYFRAAVNIYHRIKISQKLNDEASRALNALNICSSFS